MATTFNHLPIEVQEMIILKVPIGDLLRCKRVCKRWCQIINSIRYDSISIVTKYPYTPRFNCSCFREGLRYDLIETDLLVNLRSADSLAPLAQQAIFKNVKRMTTFFANLPDFNVLTDFYKQFERLEELIFDAKPVCLTRFNDERIVGSKITEENCDLYQRNSISLQNAKFKAPQDDLQEKHDLFVRFSRISRIPRARSLLRRSKVSKAIYALRNSRDPQEP